MLTFKKGKNNLSELVRIWKEKLKLLITIMKYLFDCILNILIFISLKKM